MTFKKKSMFDDIKQIGAVKSMLPESLAKRLRDAGIDDGEQNRWFWKRDGEEVKLGVDFEEKNGVMIMFGSDYMVYEIYNRFYDNLCKAFGKLWKTVGIKGQRGDQINNPEFGPAAGSDYLNSYQIIQKLQGDLQKHLKWIEDNKSEIKNFDILNQMTETLKNIIQHEQNKLNKSY